MAWRSVIISKPSRLSLRTNCLVIKQTEEISVPLEDIAVIVVESQECTLTCKLMDAITEKSIVLFTCNPGHLPSGIFLPFQKHSRFLKVIKEQFDQTLPFRKNCWKLVARQKIRNQAKVLGFLGKHNSEALYKISEEVKSGDPDNKEGYAARLYFDTYMPETTRQEDNSVNASLNYGYSIMRGAVARSLTSYGFICAVGIHHKNELNSFNLADDFMEPLRPLVDLWTAQNIKIGDEFTIKHRSALISLLNCDILIANMNMSVLRAIDIMCMSFASATLDKEPSKLKLPELTGLKTHV